MDTNLNASSRLAASGVSLPSSIGEEEFKIYVGLPIQVKIQVESQVPISISISDQASVTRPLYDSSPRPLKNPA
eukprot:gene1383-2758_t